MKWKYAKTMKDMPHKSGRYLFMSGLGVFFIGIWDAHCRVLRTQCLNAVEDTSNRYTTGYVRMAKWKFKTCGHVFWKDIGDLDYYKIIKVNNAPHF